MPGAARRRDLVGGMRAPLTTTAAVLFASTCADTQPLFRRGAPRPGRHTIGMRVDSVATSNGCNRPVDKALEGHSTRCTSACGIRFPAPGAWKERTANELQLLNDRVKDFEDDLRAMYRKFGTLLDHVALTSKEPERVEQRRTWPGGGDSQAAGAAQGAGDAAAAMRRAQRY